MSFSLLC